MQKIQNTSNKARELTQPAKAPNNESIPPSINGYGISTAQFNELLTGSQLSNSEKSFDKAVRKQQQLFTICNTLERQKTLLHKLENMLNDQKGVLWLDSQIRQFKILCPSNILMQLSKSPTSSSKHIENSEIIHLNFLSLINDIFYTPLNALEEINLGDMSEHDLKEWYEWCLKLDQQLIMFNSQIKSAQSFFSIKSFDKICYLAKDTDNQQQLGNIKYLFQQNDSSVGDVEYNE